MNELMNAQTTMSSREIAELTGKEHKNVLADIRQMLGELGLAAAGFSAAAQVPGPNRSTRTIEVINLPKRETLILVSGYSVTMRARIIDRWQELEAQAAAPASVTLTGPGSYHDAVSGLEVVCRVMGIEGAGKLHIMEGATRIMAPHLLPLLPGYAIDAPRGTDRALLTEGSSRATHSLTHLLKSRGARVSSAGVSECNEVLRELGLLERKSRASTSSPTGKVSYWCVTDAGLAYGKNVTNARNQRETAPHWYDDTFDDLCALVVKSAEAQ